MDLDEITVAYIDLNGERVEIRDRSDLVSYFGGAGVAFKLLSEYEDILRDKDTLQPEQPIILSKGFFTGVYPCATKVTAAFKSPLTKELGESNAGGTLAYAMASVGLDAIVIEGASETPVHLRIEESNVEIKDAERLWGLSCFEVESRLEGKSKLYIGEAGEKLIPFACVTVDRYRHFGRLGLGALFGSKGLKALTISGNNQVKEESGYYREILERIKEDKDIKKYSEGYGTSENTALMNEVSGLPVRNLQANRFDVENITEDAFAEFLVERKTCPGCPIRCIHVAKREAKSLQIAYDYEPIYSLGPLLGIGEAEEVLRLLEKVEEYGLDAIATGNLLAWATEAYEKGLIELSVPLKFGETGNYLETIDRIMEGAGIYGDLRKGTEDAAAIYGGEDFALTLGRNAIAGYHTGYALLLGQAVGSRHSHMDNNAWFLDFGNYSREEVVDELISDEKKRCLMNSLGLCLFTISVYELELISEALRVIGVDKSKKELLELGGEIFELKQGIKRACGFEYGKLRFPERLFETESMNGFLNRETVDKMLKRYIERM
ncbi:MAG: aldehyde:ferredoxin oxidoreductase [Methanophagales archaeon]|nr:aldehyde:ferredoxin oxidoreductase [Methanophagales archaeon]